MYFLCKKEHMRVVVLTDDELKEELLALPVGNEIKLQWIKDPGELNAEVFADAYIDLLFENNSERIGWLKKLQAPLVVINSVIPTLEAIKENFIRINGWPTFLKRTIIEAACKKESQKKPIEQLFKSFGRTIEWVPDIAGFITPRIIASIINEAHFALEEKVSNEKEIDVAMKLGTNYPYGPFEWNKIIGAEEIYNLLDALSKEKERYRPSGLLKQKALKNNGAHS
jgi:3-hydroxybutyryl-CoA dehydrogenase